MLVTERFKLNENTKNTIKSMKPEFGYNGFGAVIFYRSYSRDLDNGEKETWNDVVIRVIEGVFSIRKDWYVKSNLRWDENYWQVYAYDMAVSMFNMEWLPPGRGLWAMGTDYIYERGSMALNNCGFKIIGDDIGACCAWIMDALMCGVGVGFYPKRNDHINIFRRSPVAYTHVIEDSREGWVESVKALIDAYTIDDSDYPEFDYSLIRERGARIKGFGGISSGPEPLIKLHKQIEELFLNYENDSLRLKTDIANLIGVAVVSGNIRRSAELSAAPISDPTFIDLKNYDLYPERAAHGWMSNNSVYLESDDDFLRLDEIANRVKRNGEPGLINLRTLPLGRLDGKTYILDKAKGFNPCGEQPLEDGECCCLVETAPTRGGSFLRSCEYATVYASTVTLLRTHSQLTNSVMLRNRRIGVSIIDVSGWNHKIGTTALISNLRRGYEVVRETNNWLNDEAGIPRAIRVTTIKPGGSVPKMIGRTGGFSWPTFKETLMRVRIDKGASICKILDDAGVPKEQEIYEQNTWVYEFPVEQGPASPATEISLWQQAAMVALLQRHWSDNAVSNTLYFKPKRQLVKIDSPEPIVNLNHTSEANGDGTYSVYKINFNHEEDDIEQVLATFISQVKSVSLLPHTADGVYKQTPQSGISKQEYDRRVAALKDFDWSQIRADYETVQDKYCQGDRCELPGR